MIVITQFTGGTYAAQVRSAKDSGFRVLYRASATEGHLSAARAVIRKNFGPKATEELKQITREEIARYVPDGVIRSVSADVFLFRHAAASPSMPEKPSQSKSKAKAVEVEVVSDIDPDWEKVRETTKAMTGHGRMYLRCQVRLGMLLAGLKKRHGVREGRPSKNSPDSGEFPSWAKIVETESGYSRQSADVFIQMFHGTVAKLKSSKKLKLPGIAKKDALTLFQPESALELTVEQWDQVDAIITTTTNGETQKSLLQHLKLVPEPPPMPKGTKEGKNTEPTAGQLAFFFFDPVASSLINARTNPDYKKLLHCLPVESTEETPLSLSTLEAEFRAALADIEEIKAASLKEARGRIVA